jgi:pimeloyl-ACP methyl ester carboxylesterase
LVAALLLPLTLSAGAAAQPRPDGPADRLEWVTCDFSAEELSFMTIRADAKRLRCGYLTRAAGTADSARRSPPVRLAFAIVAAERPVPDAAPLLYLQGGPGGVALDGYMLGFEGPALAVERDVLLFDQRGVGRSTPNLCQAAGNTELRIAAADLDRAAGIAAYRRDVRECAAELARLGFDPGDYDIAATVQDVEALRTALGYHRWHLLGRSFGGLLALRVMRRYPETVESTVLVNPLSPDWFGFEHATPLAAEALALVYDACEADAACRAAFPNGREELERAHASLVRHPWRLRVDSMHLGSSEFVVNGPDLLMVVNALLYADSGIRMIPAVVHAFATRDSAAVVAILEEHLSSLKDQRMVPQFSVWCRDAVTPESRREWERASAPHSAALRDVWYLFLDVCEEWPVAPGPPELRRPLESDIPVLILSGALDPIVGVSPGAAMIERLPRGRQIVFRGLSHILPSSEASAVCAFRLMHEFLRDPRVELDARCALEGPELRISATLPEGLGARR